MYNAITLQRKTHVPQIASLRPVSRNAILWTWNVLLLCFWWISCLCDCTNLSTPLLLAKRVHFSNTVDCFLWLMLYYERLQTSIQQSSSWHGFMATCLWSWIPLRPLLSQIVGIGQIWRKLSLEPEILIMPNEAGSLRPVESNICRHLYWHRPFFNSPKFKIKSFEMKKNGQKWRNK